MSVKVSPRTACCCQKENHPTIIKIKDWVSRKINMADYTSLSPLELVAQPMYLEINKHPTNSIFLKLEGNLSCELESCNPIVYLQKTMTCHIMLQMWHFAYRVINVCDSIQEVINRGFTVIDLSCGHSHMVAYFKFFHEIVQKIGKTNANTQEMLCFNMSPSVAKFK